MNKGLSKREKFLVIFALIIVFGFAAFRFAITPLKDMYTQKQEEYERLSEEKMSIEAELMSETATRSRHKRAQNSYNEITEKYPSAMPSEDIDFLLTGICVQNNLYPITLGISDPVPLGGKGKKGGGNSQDSASFMVVSATMTLGGDYNALKGLIDTVAGMDYITISRVSFKWIAENKTTTSPNITVLFEVTMLNAAQ